MKDLSTRTTDTPQPSTQLPEYLAEKQQQGNKIFQWWYRFTSPPPPKAGASFQEHELFRRGRTGSQIIPALYLLLIISLPAGLVETQLAGLPLATNPYLLPISILGAILLTVATLLNRMGKVNVAGFIVVATFLATPMANIVTTPDGLNVATLPSYGLLVLPLVCAVSFLPPWWVFVIAAVNCLFTFYSLTSLTLTFELKAFLDTNFWGIVTPIILSQMIVSVIAYLWVSSTIQALARADQAEQIARLEHDLGKQAEAAAQRKIQLENSIQKIIETHMRVANGDFKARVPLTPDNVLWQISGSLNNLLARVQSLRQEAAELQQVRSAYQQVLEENRILKEMIQRQSGEFSPRRHSTDYNLLQ